MTATTREQTAAKERQKQAAKVVRNARHALQRVQHSAQNAVEEATQFEAAVREQEENLESNTQVHPGACRCTQVHAG